MKDDPIICKGVEWEEARVKLEAALGPLSNLEIEYIESLIHTITMAANCQHVVSIHPDPEKITGLSLLLIKVEDEIVLHGMLLTFLAFMIAIEKTREDLPGDLVRGIKKAMDLGAKEMGYENSTDMIASLRYVGPIQ